MVLTQKNNRMIIFFILWYNYNGDSMNDNRQVLTLTLLLLCSLALLIGYPTIKLLNIVKNKEQMESNMNKIVSELNNYSTSNTNFDDESGAFLIFKLLSTFAIPKFVYPQKYPM